MFSYKEICLLISIIILYFLFKFKHAVVYYAKYTYFIFVVMSCSLLYMPFFLLRPKNVDNLRLASLYCRTSSRVIGLNWIMRNTEYLTEDKAYIIVSNHQSLLDILGMFMLWPLMRKCTVIAKNELFYFWPFGLSAWLGGLMYIRREKSVESREIIVETAGEIARKKIKLWIFPEGKRFNDGQVNLFKKGAFYAAIANQIPILPVVFSYYYCIDHEKKRFDSGTTIVTVLDPISTEGKTLNDLNSLLEETYGKISNVFHEVNKECRGLNGL